MVAQLFVQIYPSSACAPMHRRFAAHYQEASAALALAEHLADNGHEKLTTWRDMAAAPESDSRPTAPAAVVLVVVPVSVTHSLSMTSRPLALRPGPRPGRGVPEARP